MERLLFLRTNLSWPLVLAEFSGSEAPVPTAAATSDAALIETIYSCSASASQEPSSKQSFPIADSKAGIIYGYGRILHKAVIVVCVSAVVSSESAPRCLALLETVVDAMNRWDIQSSSDVCQHRYLHKYCSEIMQVAAAAPTRSSFYAEALRLWRVLDKRLADRKDSGFLVDVQLSAPPLTLPVSPLPATNVQPHLPEVAVKSLPIALAQMMFPFNHRGPIAPPQGIAGQVAPAANIPIQPKQQPPLIIAAVEVEANPPPMDEPVKCDSPVIIAASAPPASPDAPTAAIPEDLAAEATAAAGDGNGLLPTIALPAVGASGDTTWFFTGDAQPQPALPLSPLPPAGTALELLPVVMPLAVQWPSLQARIDERVCVTSAGGVPSVHCSGSLLVEIVPAAEDAGGAPTTTRPAVHENFWVSATSPSTSIGGEVVWEKRTVAVRLTRWQQASTALSDDSDDFSSDDVVELVPATGIEKATTMSRAVELSFYLIRSLDLTAPLPSQASLALATFKVDDHTSDEHELLAPARCRTQWKTQIVPAEGDGEGVEAAAAHLFKCLIHLESPPHGRDFRFTAASLEHAPRRLTHDGAALSVVAQPAFSPPPAGVDERHQETYRWAIDPAVTKHVLAAKFVQPLPAGDDGAPTMGEDEVVGALKLAQRLTLRFAAEGSLSGLAAVVNTTGVSGTLPVVYRTVEGVVEFVEGA